jgi:hypothetical protein
MIAQSVNWQAIKLIDGTQLPVCAVHLVLFRVMSCCAHMSSAFLICCIPAVIILMQIIIHDPKISGIKTMHM